MADSFSGLYGPTVVWQGVTNAGVPEITLVGTGDKLFIDVPYKAYIYRACVLINGVPGAQGVVKFDIRPTYKSDTSRGDGDAGVVTIPTSGVAGQVWYKDLTTTVALTPGQQVVAEVTTDFVSGVTLARVWLLVRESPEVPGNITLMKASL